jgi:hypothetical protein
MSFTTIADPETGSQSTSIFAAGYPWLTRYQRCRNALIRYHKRFSNSKPRRATVRQDSRIAWLRVEQPERLAVVAVGTLTPFMIR